MWTTKLTKMRISYNIPGDIHCLTFTCYKYLKLLSSNRTRLYLAGSINSSRMAHNFKLFAWVFMPNHVHLIIKPTNHDYSIASILKSIKQPVARKTINYLQDQKSPLLKYLNVDIDSQKYRFWKNGGGYDRNIRDEKELLKLMEYIHNNPVRSGLVESPTDWEWSSAREWLLEIDGIIPIDRDAIL